MINMMRPFIFLLLSFASIFICKTHAQSTMSDTVRTLRPDSVIVIENDSVRQM